MKTGMFVILFIYLSLPLRLSTTSGDVDKGMMYPVGQQRLFIILFVRID